MISLSLRDSVRLACEEHKFHEAAYILRKAAIGITPSFIKNQCYEFYYDELEREMVNINPYQIIENWKEASSND